MHCASFQCLWLMGFGPDELKPDRIGGFFDAVDSGTLFLVSDKARPDPRNIPAVERFVREWTERRKAKLVVYRAGVEVKDRGGDRRERRPPR
jgi:predicted ATP-grasp superfamily ATP-dependent carboligase